MSSDADQKDADTDFILKTERSRRIQNNMKEGLIEIFKDLPSLNFLVFGPGVNTVGYETHRIPVRNMIIEKKKQNADLPEEINEDEINQIIHLFPSSSLIRKIFGNLASREVVMVRGWDYLIILLMNRGAISEFSLFMTNPDIAPKVRLFIPEEIANSDGFVNRGPVPLFKSVHDNVRTFRDPKDLLKKVCDMVEDLIVFRLTQGNRQ